MWDVLKKALGRWRLFKEIKPGHRYQTRYHNKRECRERGETSRYGKVFNLVGGPTLMVAGFLFLPTPGPTYIIIFIGLWVLSGEFLVLARFFDRAEVRMRRVGGRTKADGTARLPPLRCWWCRSAPRRWGAELTSFSVASSHSTAPYSPKCLDGKFSKFTISSVPTNGVRTELSAAFLRVHIL